MSVKDELSGAVEQIRDLCAQPRAAQGKNYFNLSVGRQHGGQNNNCQFTTLRRAYQVICLVAEGDYSQLFGAFMTGESGNDERVVIKIVDDPEDNDLMHNELRVLEYLKVRPGIQQKHLPTLVDRFVTGDEAIGQVECYGSVFKYFDGLDLLELRSLPRYRDGVPDYHAAWILERLLSVTGFVHSCGVVHCNIEPAHIMIRPRDHNLCLVDWSYAAINPAQSGDRYRVCNEIGYSAPEIRNGARPHPSADLYSIGKSMVGLLGGDVMTGEMPDTVNQKFQQLIKLMTIDDPLGRSQDAWETYRLLKEVRQEIWGKSKFIKLEI